MATDITEIYRIPELDDVEDVEEYRWGGYHPVKLNDVLDGRYKVIHKLGHGGFATIWLARDLKGHRYVAVKILMADVSTHELIFLSYLRDKGANHPNIMSLQDAFTVKGPNGLHQCLVLECVGPSLRRIAYSKCRLSGSTRRKVAGQVAEGVAYLHSTGICHGGKYLLMPPKEARHLTSSNILFELNNFDTWSEAEVYQNLGKPRTARIRLLSGAAPGLQAPTKLIESIQYSNIDEEWLTGRIRIVDHGESFFQNDPPTRFPGTPASYFAPEMAFGRSASMASDIWALGCLIYECQASHPLFPVFFNVFGEAVARVVQTFGPLPDTWREFYHDDILGINLQAGEDHILFDGSNLNYPLESRVSKIKPELTAQETTNLLSLLKATLEYEPSKRLSARQITMHAWFTTERNQTGTRSSKDHRLSHLRPGNPRSLTEHVVLREAK
ncbi:MAG: hypothetical protein M1816_007717 [Peltula sp. TS41687]|nr:MAG: hypothetical protein M1816_007717 [Peltula sp. TS41687]